MRVFRVLALMLLSEAVVAGEFVSVMVGGHGDIDACMSIGVINNKTDNGEINVRKGPSEDYTVSDTLKSGKTVWLCGDSGNWIGIVYPSSKDGTCEVSSPINPRQPYKGVCESGWIKESDIEVAAG